MKICFAKKESLKRSRIYCEESINPVKFYEVPKDTTYIRVYKGKLSFGVIKNEERAMIRTQRGKFFRIPSGMRWIKLADFVIFEKNYCYGKPTWW